jgi:predicted metal-dependent peptidase
MKHDLMATSRLKKARTSLLLDHPFFGTLLFRLKERETCLVETMATDGVSLFYNPGFVASLSAAELAGVLAHEVMHPALQHHVRRRDRNPKRWNIACDYAINPLLSDAGLALPKGVLLDDRFRGMSAERIYNLIAEHKLLPADSASPDNEDERRLVPSTPGGVGQVIDAPNGDGSDGRSSDEQSRDWQIAVRQAANLVKIAGKTPEGLERTLKEADAATVDWRGLLRTQFSEFAPAEYSWMRPNRRLLWTGLYLPGLLREGVGEIAIAVDCSGSVDARVLGLFEAEIRSIVDGQRPERVHVLYFDSLVQRVETYEAGELIRLNPLGGGGTEFGPIFEWFSDQGITPQTLVVLTDLYGSFPAKMPDFPVIWASTGGGSAPFGKVVPLGAA